MRPPSAGGTDDAGRCCRCEVPGALFFYVQCIMSKGCVDKNYEDETRHPSTGGTHGGGGC